MNGDQILELVGYFASALVLVSLLMTSIVKLRVLNAVGALIFTVYAVLIGSWPTAVMNACLVVIDLVFLVKVLRNKAQFSMVSVAPGDSALDSFLRIYDADIRGYFPEWDRSAAAAGECYLVYADAVPAGVMVGRREGEDTLRVDLDYSSPTYRDCSVGECLYARLPAFGIRTLISGCGEERHNKYLLSQGFTEKDGVYCRTLD